MFEAVAAASFQLLKYVSTVKYKSIVPATSVQVNPVALETSDKIVVSLRTIARTFPSVSVVASEKLRIRKQSFQNYFADYRGWDVMHFVTDCHTRHRFKTLLKRE